MRSKVSSKWDEKKEDNTNIKCWSKNVVCDDAHAHKQIRTRDFLCEFQYFIVKLLEFYVHGDGSLIRDLAVASAATAADE